MCRAQQFENLINVCNRRFDAIREIKKALYYELALAKRADGQHVNVPRKPKHTLQDWDAVLF